MKRLRGTLGLGLTAWLSMGCGPAGSMAGDTEGDTDTDGTGGTGSTGGEAASNTTPDPTNASDDSDATTSPDPETGPPETTDEPTTATTGDPGSTDGTGSGDTDTGECPLGSEGCPCDVGAACDDGLQCDVNEGICVGEAACRPIDTDPHGDEATATEITELACDNAMDLGVVATVAGPETDWFTFFGDDGFGCAEQPAAVVTADETLTVCVYIECVSGDVDTITCAGAATDATSPEDRPGCCGELEAAVENYDCSGFGGKDVDVYVSVGSVEEVCLDYGLAYSF